MMASSSIAARYHSTVSSELIVFEVFEAGS